MLLEKERRKVDLIEALAERVRDLAEERGEEAARFVCCFYAQVPPADLLEMREEDLCGAALAIWSFARSRTPGKPKVRLYNPNREDNGWGSPHTIVEIVNDDMPFLVDSVACALARLDAPVRLVIHPVLKVRRNAAGGLLELRRGEADPGRWSSESWMQLEIEEQGPERHTEIAEELERVLGDVRLAVGDWRAMRQRCAEIIAELESAPPPLPEEEIAETLAFLRWLNDNHFTYLGYREYRFEGTGPKAVAHVLPDVGLGLLRDAEYTVFDGLRHLGRLPRDVRHFVRQPDLLRITKANRRARVHRDVYMDTVTLKAFDEQGNVTGERLFLGLFTASAYAESLLEIPILRQKALHVLERSGVDTVSHDGRSMLHILATYPRDELFQITAAELLEVATDILHLQERRRIALFVRRDPFERFVSCLVYVPREIFDTYLREKLQGMVAGAYEGSVSAFYTHMTDAPLARVHFIVKTTPGQVPYVDVEELEQRLIEAGRSWESRLEALLVDRVGEGKGIRCARRFARAFPPTYRESFDEATAVADIGSIEQAIETGDLAMRLYRPVGMRAEEMQLKMFTAGSPLPLSDVMPMLENMGLQVLDEVPYDVDTEEMGARVYIRDFHLRSQMQQEIDLAAARGLFYEALGRVWRREMANDGFNRLVLGAGLGSREVTVLRAYSRYLHQLRAPFSQASIESTLARNPSVAGRLVELFLIRFEPARKDRREGENGLIAEIETLLEKVVSLDEDRILRRLLNLILSTLRTNYFQTVDGAPKPYLALKLDSTRIEQMPSPRPFREIWVFGPCFEGVHLRGGEVARGGIRWSDRRDDFRTEILGLMKAQMTKNAVIVPIGAKGGFVLACHVTDRRELQQEAVGCYRDFIRGLLDLTDNRDGHLVVPPTDVVRHDGDDSYLVVAADKGTATFSDIANEVAAEYGFWLGDAFASGGSAGYDHKKMAITARGAWESVKRHFREMGLDVQSQDFTVVGVGDMAGDVFGNGMLQSPHIRLLGAFNHEHVFIDPDPEPARSFAERRRLFETAGSTWMDYDRAALSAGGGVFDRQAKAIRLSDEIRRLFGIDQHEVTPAELIRALLAAPVDLLWFGGIGTFVKSRDESHFGVGDRPNDGVRIDAQELRAKVVAEGANLGMTQLARIDYARGGGRLNTDAVDNCAGVACSDREVNIKILLSEVERDGDMTRKQRNELLAQMTEEVAELVLRINYLQTQTISVTHQLGAHLLDRLARVMRSFEKKKVLDRRIEFLPGDEEIEERLARREGFTRPELAVLLAYAKNDLFAQLVRSDLSGNREADRDVLEYFPSLLRERYAARIVRHGLRRELVSTIVANELLNRGGLAFVSEVQEKTGATAPQIARAFIAAREVLEMRALWEDIEAQDNRIPWQRQASMMLDCGRLMELGTVWLLHEEGASLDIGAVVKAYRGGVRELREGLEELVSREAADGLSQRLEALREEGVPEALARHVAALPLLGTVWDVVRIARSTRLPLPPVARLFFEVGERFGFEWLRRAANHLLADSAWDKLAVSALLDDLLGHQGELVRTIVHDSGDDLEGSLQVWEARNQPVVARTDQLLSELQSLGNPALSMLAVANRQLKSLSRWGRAEGVSEKESIERDRVGVEP